MHIAVQIGLVALGSALGGLLRWGVTIGLARLLGTAFPWGTFFINITGSFFLGWFVTMLSERLIPEDSSWIRAEDLRLLVAVGFTGGYTTFSTFELESSQLIRHGDNVKALIYLFGSVLLGLLAVRLGMILARVK